MKLFAGLLALSLSLTALAESTSGWLHLLNAEPGRQQPLTAQDVVFRPAQGDGFEQLVAAGFRQSDGSLSLGSLIWKGKVYNPLQGYAQILSEMGFAEASDPGRLELFLKVLKHSNDALGIHPYSETGSREDNRPKPPVGSRQADGQHRFVIWFWVEPGNREGPEWRQVLYLVSADGASVRARTLQTYHPDAEGLRGFPTTP
jgi:hypothetical protein